LPFNEEIVWEEEVGGGVDALLDAVEYVRHVEG